MDEFQIWDQSQRRMEGGDQNMIKEGPLQL